MEELTSLGQSIVTTFKLLSGMIKDNDTHNSQMSQLTTIAIFDIGKTNKKLLLFDEQYKVVYEQSMQLEETTDEDGFPCEDIHALTNWINSSFDKVLNDERFDIKAVNFSGYGASFVFLDKDGSVLPPLYNYLKPFPEKLKKQFYDKYGGENIFSRQTASPVLGNLNSGMQLYRIKYEKPALFQTIGFALHLPQYLSYILTNRTATDITSVGCHTNLWNFEKRNYHRWVEEEGIDKLFAPLLPSVEHTSVIRDGKEIMVGYGLHDSSAALIPYLTAFSEPFILLSTGTWCISLNPFNHVPLTDEELHHDCLCFLSYHATAVKASRLFAGYEHEQQTKRLAAHFNKAPNYFTSVVCDEKMLEQLQQEQENTATDETVMVQQSSFAHRDLNNFDSYESAYHQLIADIVAQQVRSTQLVLSGTPVKRIFVDGGFSKNSIYMHLLAKAFHGIEVYAASVAQASALGAALTLHEQWNSRSLPDNLIELKLYAHAEHVA